MHFHASQSISQLEAEAAALSLTNLRMEMKVADKDKDLTQLRSQVSELSEEADNIKDKLKSVNALEQELQALINKSKVLLPLQTRMNPNRRNPQQKNQKLDRPLQIQH